MNNKYPAKLILFGEYSVINNSEAMAIPSRLFEGKWEFESQNQNSKIISNKKLFEILSYLEHNDFETLDLKTFKSEISNGIWFDSNIPFGYGLGSSGALCAAIYDRYAIEKTTDLVSLKAILGKIESFFHGTSSGTDPLVSYLNKPIIINEDQSISILPEFKNVESGKIVISLIDCGFARNSSKLVSYYIDSCIDPVFVKNYVEPIKKEVKKSIRAILNNTKVLKETTKIISQLQLAYMKNMIPNEILPLWEGGINSEKYSLKLCGAGGGGFMLAFSYDNILTEMDFKNFKTHKLLTL